MNDISELKQQIRTLQLHIKSTVPQLKTKIGRQKAAPLLSSSPNYFPKRIKTDLLTPSMKENKQLEKEHEHLFNRLEQLHPHRCSARPTQPCTLTATKMEA